MIGSAIANAAISPVLIFGLLGFPKMEIAGAAIGTLVARSSVLLLSLYIINKRFGLISWLTHPLIGCISRRETPHAMHRSCQFERNGGNRSFRWYPVG